MIERNWKRTAVEARNKFRVAADAVVVVGEGIGRSGGCLLKLAKVMSDGPGPLGREPSRIAATAGIAVRWPSNRRRGDSRGESFNAAWILSSGVESKLCIDFSISQFRCSKGNFETATNTHVKRQLRRAAGQAAAIQRISGARLAMPNAKALPAGGIQKELPRVESWAGCRRWLAQAVCDVLG